MAKGFWIVTTTITSPAFKDYVEAFQPWVESLGGSVFAKDMDSKTVEGKGGKLAVIIEFPSKEAAIDAYKRADYQGNTRGGIYSCMKYKALESW